MAADGERNNLDFATAMTDHVTVGRSLTAEAGGVIAAYTMTSDGGTERPVTVEVRDFLPNWGIEEIGFHPEFEPDEGSITENKVAFRNEVPPDETLVVKYGLTLSASEPVEVVARQQSLNPPRVTEVDAPDGAGGEASSEPFATPGEGEDADGESLVFEEDGGEAPADGPERDDREGTPDDSDATAEARDAPSFSTPPTEDAVPSLDVSPPTDEGPSTGDAPSPEDAESAFEDGGPSSDDSSSGGSDDSSSVEGDGVVAALLDEIERGTVSDAQLAALREALGTGTSTSVDVRLRHVHARMEEFAAYTDALQSLLDGGDVEAVADVREDVDELRSELEAVREDQRATAERLDALETAVEAFESEVEAGFEELRADLDAAAPADGGGASAAEVEELRNAVNVLARDVEERFADLWATIDAVNRTGEAASADAIN